MDIVNILRDKILDIVYELVEEKKFKQPLNINNIVVERPKKQHQGDYSANVAMVLGKMLSWDRIGGYFFSNSSQSHFQIETQTLWKSGRVSLLTYIPFREHRERRRRSATRLSSERLNACYISSFSFPRSVTVRFCSSSHSQIYP